MSLSTNCTRQRTALSWLVCFGGETINNDASLSGVDEKFTFTLEQDTDETELSSQKNACSITLQKALERDWNVSRESAHISSLLQSAHRHANSIKINVERERARAKERTA